MIYEYFSIIYATDFAGIIKPVEINQKGRDHLKNLGIDGGVILKWILNIV
jgi:hypothetical protein